MKLKHNFTKLFIIKITERRVYISLLSLYFLTLPNSTANQIGIYNLIGTFVAFLLEIPSGYMSDKFGHKNALLLSKIFFFTSTLCFIFGKSLLPFIIGFSLLSLGFSFSSGSFQAFAHSTLRDLKQDHLYTKIMSKMHANASIITSILLTLLPFLTSISLLLPFKIAAILDFIGIITVLTLANPKYKKTEKTTYKQIKIILKKYVREGFYVFSTFTGLIGGFAIVTSNFRSVYLESIGLSITLVGFVYGISGVLWFFIGHNIHLIEKHIKIKQLLIFETIFFPAMNILAALFAQPCFVLFVFSLSVGYWYARRPLITNYLLTRFIKDKRYKATFLSVQSQISLLIHGVGALLIAHVMDISFRLGFFILGISLLVCLGVVLIYLIPFHKKAI